MCFQERPSPAGSGEGERDGLALTSPPHLDPHGQHTQSCTRLIKKTQDLFAALLLLELNSVKVQNKRKVNKLREGTQSMSCNTHTAGNALIFADQTNIACDVAEEKLSVCGSRCPVGMEKLVTAAWWPNWQVDNGFIVFGSV